MSLAISKIARRAPRRWRAVIARMVFVVVLPGALLGCATSTPVIPKTAPLVWPGPPEPPRLAFVQSILQPADLGLKKSGWSRLLNWILGTGTEGKLVKPFGIALDEADNLCVTDTGANRISFFDRVARQWTSWDHVENIRFASPVAVAKRGDALFVADSMLRSVIAFNTKGKLLFLITNQIGRPAGLAISGENLLVVDSQSNRVVAFDFAGKYLWQFGQRGAGPGEFSSATHISADARGALYVTDSLNCRIQLFDRTGHYQASLGSMGDSPGHFGRPKGVAADSYGNVYVMDALFDTLQVFKPDGQLALALGGTGAAPGEFWLPNGLAISRDNQIFIADTSNRRIQVLRYIGGL